MPKYIFFVCNKRERIKYPKSFYLADVKAAHQVAVRIAQTSGEVFLRWNELFSNSQTNFAIEAVNEAGQTVLTVPYNEAGQSKIRPDGGKDTPHKHAPPGFLN